jgi:predicted MFS family arabinose efflux permease
MSSGVVPNLAPLGRPQPPLFIATMVVLGCVAFTFFTATPLLVAFMAQQWGFGPAQIGFIVTADTAGNTLGALAVAKLIRGWPVRRIMALGMLAMMGGNGVIALGWGLNVSMAGGFLAGLGNGVVSASAIGFLAYSKDPQRNISFLVVAQNFYAMALMGAILPVIGGQWQASGAFLFIAAVGIVCLPAMFLFARRETIPAAFRQGEVNKVGVYLTLLTLYTCYTGVGVIWTFLSTLGASYGLEKEYMARVLTIANFASLTSCFVVGAMARHSLFGWSRFVVMMTAVGAAGLAMPLTPTTFAVATMIFVACWTLFGILVPTLLPVFDPVGRHAALTPAILGLGYSTGSFMGGLVAEAASPRTAFVVAACCIGLSAVLLFVQRFFVSAPSAPQLPPADLKRSAA